MDEKHISCWRIFVKACRILSSQIYTYEQVLMAHDLLRFGMEVEALYGCKYNKLIMKDGSPS